MAADRPMTEPSAQRGTVRVDTPAAGVLRLRIENPARRGALSPGVLDGFLQALGVAPADARCLIVTGTGATFSAGYDLRELSSPPDPVAADEAIAADSVELLTLLERQPLPVVAALNGPALGGGVELALAADIRLAVPAASFGAPAGRLGLVYSPGGLERILAEVPFAVASDLFLAGGTLSAERALALGLVSRLVAPGELDAAAVTVAADVAALAPLSVRAHRRALRSLRSGGRRFTAGERAELERARAQAMTSAEFAEGVAAFQEHRQPRFGPG